MTLAIDLNCDLGEQYGVYELGRDAELLPLITSANIACGFHAGDPGTMRRTVKLALENGVAIGAHPGLPDLIGFGRREMAISPEEAYDLTVYQISALNGFVMSEGGVMHHVKPHGALYNMAARRVELAEAIAEAVYRVNPELILYGLSGSELIHAGKKRGLRTASEVFADRTYQQDGSLTPRSHEGALIEEPNEALKQLLQMIREGAVWSTQGVKVPLAADTICVHGDGEKALLFVQQIRKLLESEGIILGAPGSHQSN
ncbi:lactam utilization protein LamB [Paenibacillus sp. BIHB 4019]|uniref:5-oxoprolinase subunit A n=1 Tax=Paenibacillus sp. BIHB 4019 TaxID=1870819 RepID=A0A1B2DP67_9BACL|nr:5-oxoprolinase subunit PxpA [Paenibacillus sp. BIHB 4019]ANY69505.1 lactam utilization protein LamB [Paenibacillus sp. BIHB 4019]